MIPTINYEFVKIQYIIKNDINDNKFMKFNESLRTITFNELFKTTDPFDSNDFNDPDHVYPIMEYNLEKDGDDSIVTVTYCMIMNNIYNYLDVMKKVQVKYLKHK